MAVRPLCDRDEPSARRVAEDLQLPLWSELSAAQQAAIGVFLEVDGEALALGLPSWSRRTRVRVDFDSGRLGYRQQPASLQHELLAKALAADKAAGMWVLDATAGLGTDTLLLAALGFRVTAVERHPVLHYLLQAALRQARSMPDHATYLDAIELHHAEAGDWLASTQNDPDIFYLDPMFPARSKSAAVKKEMTLMQALVGEDDAAGPLLEQALDRVKYRVVVKRPPQAPPLAGRQPTSQLTGKAVRFDIYALRSPARWSNSEA